MEIKKLKVSQLARAIETITGTPTTAKSFNYKFKAVDRVIELMNEHKLTREQILQAAGLTRIETPKTTVPPKVTTAKPQRITKQSILIDMLQTGSGASIDELTKATGWQPHTVRGAISNVLRKKLGLNVVNEQSFSGKQVYRIYDEA
ncbi:DUF3489 domain-containing protein [Thalassospira sp.]|uniref:DUF3489 domain-containing protein n=1 Tax=Thalassospira sp. TaxID=1912094 RepID=UPI001B11E2BD|nr:DUF3489 domain-containing protein [Thalassospira sp.]MBO6522127.1 DUF3489 domain-containing protein [Rhodospirillales bacterium]MBO6773759.1 DUF3489 domain-containing protein [Thalassospira sp.]